MKGSAQPRTVDIGVKCFTSFLSVGLGHTLNLVLLLDSIAAKHAFNQCHKGLKQQFRVFVSALQLTTLIANMSSLSSTHSCPPVSIWVADISDNGYC